MKGFRESKKQTKADMTRQFNSFVKHFDELKAKNLSLEDLRSLYEQENPKGMRKEAFIEASKAIMARMMEEQFKKETEEYNKTKQLEQKTDETTESNSSESIQE